jgi:Zn ribbon nucleic-acid-binding protein
MGKLPRGVSLTAQGRFQSRIWRHGGSVHLGVFENMAEAGAAYRAACMARANPIADAPATEEPEPEPTPAPTEKPTEQPQEEPQAEPAALPERARAVPPGGCPACGADAALYQLIGSADDARRCSQCGHQTRRATFDEQGRRVVLRDGIEEGFAPAGVSRAQYADLEWRRAHVQKGPVLV